MKKIFLALTMVLSAAILQAQTTEAEDALRAKNADTLLGWKKGCIVNLGLSQVSLTNWAAGGQNSLSLNGLISVFAHKKMKTSFWENYLDLGYGMLQQGNVQGWRKTDDKVDLLTKYGQQISGKYYFAALANFKTQMTPGYNFGTEAVRISNLLAPAYILSAIGVETEVNSYLSLFVAPVTSKITLVYDQDLADAGAFGVRAAEYDGAGTTMLQQGKNIRSEIGAYARVSYRREIMKNVTLKTKLDLFSNYLHNPQNIDVNWDLLVVMKVNKYISATLGTNLIYDDDIKIALDRNNDGVIDASGPRVQFKELISAGFSCKF